ncbi:MAG TPA: flagellar basal body rod protein FlgC [Firmicutes bacterium]|nr:flagellar basal body rod protein FlgC [Bacillota bacterium]
MLLSKSFGISGSGLTAERLRLDIIAANLANANSTRTPEGGPYRRKVAVLEARQAPTFAGIFGGIEPCGVRVARIAEDQTEFPVRYEPGHPDADASGYVKMSNVNVVNEMVDLITATRAYEANATAMNAAKTMARKALELGKA